jgi:hypothetical protein
MTENMKMKFNASAQRRSQTGAENGLQIFSASLCVLRASALILSEMIWLNRTKTAAVVETKL